VRPSCLATVANSLECCSKRVELKAWCRSAERASLEISKLDCSKSQVLSNLSGQSRIECNVSSICAFILRECVSVATLTRKRLRFEEQKHSRHLLLVPHACAAKQQRSRPAAEASCKKNPKYSKPCLVSLQWLSRQPVLPQQVKHSRLAACYNCCF